MNACQVDAAACLLAAATTPAALTTWLGLAIVVSYFLVAGQRLGRDQRSDVPVPVYYPPKAVPAAALRFLRRMAYDHRVLSAALLELAAKHQIRFEQENAKTTIERCQNAPVFAPAAGERALLDVLTRTGRLRLGGRRIKGKYAAMAEGQIEQGDLIAAHKAALKEFVIPRLFDQNQKAFVRGGELTLAVSGVILLVVLLTRFSAFFEFLFVGLTLTVVTLALAQEAGKRTEDRYANVLALTLGTLILGTAGVAGELLLPTLDGYDFAWLPMAGFCLIHLINNMAVQMLKAPTIEGRRLIHESDGLRLYMEAAEQDTLEYKHPPGKTPERYAALLPYAVALDVENAWADKFGQRAGESLVMTGITGETSDLIDYWEGTNGLLSRMRARHRSAGRGKV